MLQEVILSKRYKHNTGHIFKHCGTVAVLRGLQGKLNESIIKMNLWLYLMRNIF